MRFNLFYIKVVITEKLNICHFKFLEVRHSDISRHFSTLLQSYSKIFHHPTSHLLRDRRDFFLYALLYFRYGSRLTDENSAFEIPS